MFWFDSGTSLAFLYCMLCFIKLTSGPSLHYISQHHWAMNKLQPHHSLIQSVCFSAHSESNKPQEFPLGLRLLSAWGMCVCVCTCFYTSLALSVLFSRHARLWTNNVLFMAQSLCANTHEHRDACLCVWRDTTQPSPLSVYCFSPCRFIPKVLYLAHKKRKKKELLKTLNHVHVCEITKAYWLLSKK